MSKFTFLFLTLALTSVFAESLKVTFSSPVTVGGQTLSPGEYKVQLDGQKATFSKSGKTIETPAVVEENATKAKDTRIETANPGGQLKAIEFGGSTKKVIFQSAPTTANAGGN